MLCGKLLSVVVFAVILAVAGPAGATILTFEVFDPALDVLPYNDPTVDPVLPGHGYREGFAVAQEYGDNVTTSPAPGPNNYVFQYGFGAEGTTPNIAASYGPTSIFTGGPNLWREGYGDLDGILYQGSRFDDPNSPFGTNYNHLDIVLYGDPGWDVVLYGFDLGAAQGDKNIDAVVLYPGVPFPFITPNNHIFLQPNVDVEGDTRTTFDFSGSPWQGHVLLIRINANKLGNDSENIGIDNIRIGQVANAASTQVIDPEAIAAALADPVPEPAALVLCVVGLLSSLGMVVWRRRRRVA